MTNPIIAKKLRLCTWNAGGLMSNVVHLQNCLEKSDICVVQEHWLYPDSLNFMATVNANFTGWGRSSNDLNLDSIWRRGKGGIGILWGKSLNPYITKMDDLGDDRILVIRVKETEGQDIFIVGVYLPSSNCGIDLYRACIEKLEEIVYRLNDHGTLFIAGDFNAHILGIMVDLEASIRQTTEGENLLMLWID